MRGRIAIYDAGVGIPFIAYMAIVDKEGRSRERAGAS